MKHTHHHLLGYKFSDSDFARILIDQVNIMELTEWVIEMEDFLVKLSISHSAVHWH